MTVTRRYRIRSWKTSKSASRVFWTLCLTIFSLAYGCHRSEFSRDLTTQCPEPKGALVVLDYTLNGVYVGDTPEGGCPDSLPHDYLYMDTYICSERADATTGFLQTVIDTYLDVDAAIAAPNEVTILSDAEGATLTAPDGSNDGGL